MNIASQREIERDHYQLTIDTSSSQTWLSVFKMFVVMAICGLQVYFTTSFFASGRNMGSGRKNDINPFANSAI